MMRDIDLDPITLVLKPCLGNLPVLQIYSIRKKLVLSILTYFHHLDLFNPKTKINDNFHPFQLL